jgi:ribose 5-phosphate isomerase B
MSERIVLGADHGGYELKRELVEGLREAGYTVDDVGTHGPETCDYPDFAHAVAQGILAGRYQRGILVCGTGIGMAITANRYSGIRAANCADVFSARFSRAHNNANVLTLGGRVLGVGLAWEIVNVWLKTPFGGDARHLRRVSKIEDGIAKLRRE